MHRRRFTALAASLIAVNARAGVPSEPVAASEAVATLRHTTAAGASLLFIGTRHTFAPQDPQLEWMRSVVTAFAPTVALVEGGNWPTEHPETTLVERYGEMAFAARVARDCGATVVNADPPFQDEVRRVAERFGVASAKLFYVLRRVPQTLQERGDQTPERRLVSWMNSRQLNVLPGMADVLTNLDEIDAEIRRVAPQIGTWRNASDPNVAAPIGSRSPINDMARASVTYREEFVTQKVGESLHPGSRVLLVMGGGHLEAMRSNLKLRLASMGRG
jgi:hypothetical protein